MNDLTGEEQAHVRTALRYLRARTGSWRLLAELLRTEKPYLERVVRGEKGVSASITFRAARVAGVPIDDLLIGKFPVERVCLECGHPVPNGNSGG